MSMKRRICEKFERSEIIRNEEDWKPIKIYGEEEEYSHYYISKNGVVWNSKTKTCLKIGLNNANYCQCCIHGKTKGKQKVSNVGFLVASTFLYDEYVEMIEQYGGYENCKKGGCNQIDVSHKNNVKTDNSVTNLKWELHRTNIGDKRRLRLMSESMKRQWANPEWSKRQGKLISLGRKKSYQRRKEENEKSEVN